MDINPTNNNAVLSDEERQAFRNQEMGNVVTLDTLREVLPMLLTLAHSRFESTQVNNPDQATPAHRAEADAAKAELELVEGMNTELMVYDMGQFLGDL